MILNTFLESLILVFQHMKTGKNNVTYNDEQEDCGEKCTVCRKYILGRETMSIRISQIKEQVSKIIFINIEEKLTYMFRFEVGRG